MLRIEDVAFEQLRRMAGKLVRDPGQDPLVQLGVGVVVARQCARSRDEWPRVDDGQQEAQGSDGASAVTEHVVELCQMLNVEC